MIVIADTNIFYSTLIQPQGEVASILKETQKIQFFIPDYLVQEIYEHLPSIVAYINSKGNKKTQKQVITELKTILKEIKIVPIQEIKKSNVLKAKKIVADIDPDDFPFIALHLQIKHKIWTGDETLKKGLTAKGYGHFFISTQELKNNLYKNK